MAQAEEIRTETGPLDYDYTEKEVELCQENLQNHKACSPDKIKNEMLKLNAVCKISGRRLVGWKSRMKEQGWKKCRMNKAGRVMNNYSFPHRTLFYAPNGFYG
eukprot:g71284.t1